MVVYVFFSGHFHTPWIWYFLELSQKVTSWRKRIDITSDKYIHTRGCRIFCDILPFSSLARELRADIGGAPICQSLNSRITFSARILPYLEYCCLENGQLNGCRPNLTATCLSVTIEVKIFTFSKRSYLCMNLPRQLRFLDRSTNSVIQVWRFFLFCTVYFLLHMVNMIKGRRCWTPQWSNESQCHKIRNLRHRIKSLHHKQQIPTEGPMGSSLPPRSTSQSSFACVHLNFQR